MVLAEISVGNVGGLMAIIAAVIPILLGGVTTYFKIFLISKQDFRNRAKLKQNSLREKMAIKLAMLLKHAHDTRNLDDPLRGDGYENADLVGDYTEENLRVFTVYHRLAFLESIIRYAYFLLYLTIVFGLVGVFLAWLLPITRGWVLGVSIGLVIIQVATVFTVQLASWKLDDYEDVV
ncbi:MAG: hypothetical protein K8S55_00495 [Phycisphaerae bacterium]|nr:hypothetical protein [Phycisphaerae bacterium]